MKMNIDDDLGLNGTTSLVDENLRAVRGAYDNGEIAFQSAVHALVAGGWSEDRAFKEVNSWPEPTRSSLMGSHGASDV